MACVSDPPTTTRVLPSGRQIEVISVGVVGDADGRWVLEYRTLLPITPHERLQCEVEAIWSDVKGEAENAGVRRAGIWPTSFDHELRWVGWRPVMLGQMMTAFSLERDGQGGWRKAGGWSATPCP